VRTTSIRTSACVAVLATGLIAASAAAVLGASPVAGFTTVVCTDATTDAAAVQSAINDSAAGSTIQIAGPTCLLTAGITLLGDRSYVGGATGDETGTVLKQDGTLPYLLASDAYVQDATTRTGDPLAVRSLSLQCDGTGSTDGVIIESWDVDVQQVDVDDCGGSGIVDTSTDAAGQPLAPATTGAAQPTSVNSRFENDFITNSGQYGFAVIDTKNVVTDGFLLDNQISNSGLDQISMQTSTGWNISGNHLYGDGHNGIVADNMWSTTIADNYIEDFDADKAAGTYSGILAQANGGNTSVISGNKVFEWAKEATGATYDFIQVSALYGDATLVSFGNALYGNGTSADVGFAYAGAGYTLGVTSTGNSVQGMATAMSLGTGATASAGI
jgi:hypothetical protein